ncbi:MAG TPA: glycosyltransferase family 25 protein [Ottowia sp.]|uniref:glycosyltransferase family 25 protein n=1 Tax=Ottowia sp. TaxID=1898956 RepID=UPI002C938435|nr:glycosyltransferase family 25 protein [Ottowia sp.]HMN20863.1 glycosyltransferase family 25 protein [Ottowia sp.]
MDQTEVVVISLTRAAARRDGVARELGRLGIDFRFFDAVDGARLESLPAQYDRQRRLRQYGVDLSAGELGCFLSHRAVWQECVASQRDFLVLEDDFRVAGDLAAIVDGIAQVSEPWDFIRLSGDREQRRIAVPVRSLGAFTVVEELSESLLTTGYVVNPRGAARLLRSSERFWMPVDNFMEMRYAHGIRSLSVLPYPIEHLPLGSTIGDRAVRDKPMGWRLWFRSLHDLNRYAWVARRFCARKLYGS